MSENLTKKQKTINLKLLKAIDNNDLSAVIYAVENGADVNTNNDEQGTPLYRSSFKNMNIAKYLLEHNADPNIPSINNLTALHEAASSGCLDRVKLLLEYGADMTLRDGWGRTPFSNALYWEKYDIAELFVLSGYVPSDEDFCSPWIWMGDAAKSNVMKEYLTVLAAQVQEHRHKLTEEAKAAEFAYADEVIEM